MYVRVSIAWHARSTSTASTPTLVDEELYACDEIPSEITSPRSDHEDQNWIVEDAAQARALAETTSALGVPIMWSGEGIFDG